MVVAGGVAAFLAIQGYLTPLSGIDGEPAPLLTAFGGVSLLLAGVLLWRMRSGLLRGLLVMAALLAAVGTALAGFFMLQQTIMIAALVAGLGVLLVMLAGSREASA